MFRFPSFFSLIYESSLVKRGKKLKESGEKNDDDDGNNDDDGDNDDDDLSVYVRADVSLLFCYRQYNG